MFRSRKAQLRADLDTAAHVIDQLGASRLDLEERLDLANKYVDRVNVRNAELVKELYELRRQLRDLRRAAGVAGQQRPHSACVDAWADGRDPCVDCEPLLPKSTTTEWGRA